MIPTYWLKQIAQFAEGIQELEEDKDLHLDGRITVMYDDHVVGWLEASDVYWNFVPAPQEEDTDE